MRTRLVAAFAMALAGLYSSAGRAEDRPSNGWTSLVPRNDPLETSADKLCGKIDSDDTRYDLSRHGLKTRTVTPTPENYCSPLVDKLKTSQQELARPWTGRQRAAFEREAKAWAIALDKCIVDARTAFRRNQEERTGTAPTADLGDIVRIPADQRVPAEAQRVATEIAGCRAEADRRRAVRLAVLPTLTPEAIEKMDSLYRMPEEWAFRKSELLRRDELLARLRGEPKFRDVEYGRRICQAQRRRVDALAEIRTESKYSRLGGVSNLSRVYGLQSDVRDADEEILDLRREARLARAHVPPCNDRGVRDAITCVDAPGDAPPAQCLAGDNPARVWVAASEGGVPAWVIEKIATLK